MSNPFDVTPTDVENMQEVVQRVRDAAAQPTHTKPLVDAPIVTNERGGRQSHVAERYDLMPAGAMKALAQILSMGAVRYGENNWHKIPIEEHVNHAIAHLYEYLDGETTEDHLGHAMCRAMFALYLQQERDKRRARKQARKSGSK